MLNWYQRYQNRRQAKKLLANLFGLFAEHQKVVPPLLDHLQTSGLTLESINFPLTELVKYIRHGCVDIILRAAGVVNFSLAVMPHNRPEVEVKDKPLEREDLAGAIFQGRLPESRFALILNLRNRKHRDDFHAMIEQQLLLLEGLEQLEAKKQTSIESLLELYRTPPKLEDLMALIQSRLSSDNDKIKGLVEELVRGFSKIETVLQNFKPREI